MRYPACLAAALIAGAFGPAAAGQTPARVVERPQAEVLPHLVRRVEPIYPNIAVVARVEGTVKVRAVIAADGRVQSARVIRSVPLLDQAALDAVRQWRFEPFVADGERVAVQTDFDIEFAIGGSPRVRDTTDRFREYRDRSGDCQEFAETGRVAEAFEACRALVELAEALPRDRQPERARAYGLAGAAFAAARRWPDAVRMFEREMSTWDRVRERPSAAEAGRAATEAARVSREAGNTAQARRFYGFAEERHRRAWVGMTDPEIKADYGRELVDVLEEFAAFLAEVGHVEAAAATRARAESVARQIRR